MAITVGSIVDALISLGGSAHYEEIAAEVLRTGHPPFPDDPSASVRARLQENCSDYKAYKNKQDLFESSRGSGVWSLRAFASPSHDEAPTSSGHFSEEPEIYEAKEGNQVLRAHMDRERSSPLISKFKASLADPRCEACTVQLSEIYGDLAKDYIEAHHRIPISKVSERLTHFEDLAALCPNCHRVIHKNYPMSVEELGDILAESDSFSQHLIAVRSSRATWQAAVRNAIERLVENTSNRRFSRQLLIERELDKIVEEVNSTGITPSQTLSRVLQELRDNNEIVFVDEERGEYLVK